jgi:predicted nuclease of predicted toxin-antitoxin system
LCKTLGDIVPASLHIRLLGQGGATDATVWDLVRHHGCLLVSKDEDFHRLTLLRGAPPKFVWIRLGNCTTDDIVQLLDIPKCFRQFSTLTFQSSLPEPSRNRLVLATGLATCG